MRQPKTFTFVAAISKGKEDELRSYLKNSVDMKVDGTDNEIAFSKLPALHFCAMFIIDRDELLDKPPMLVIEATIDGEIREFLENMLEMAPKSLARILGDCEGYPASSLKLKRLIIDYMMLRLVADKAHHCGYPGRTVAQIIGEQKLRSAILETVDTVNSSKSKAFPTAEDIHRHIKFEVDSDTSLNWARAKAEPPKPVRYRNLYLSALLVAVVAIPVFLTLLWAYRLFAVSPAFLLDLTRNCGAALPIYGGAVPENCGFLKEFLPRIAAKLIAIVILLAIVWMVFTALQNAVGKYRENVQKSFFNELLNIVFLSVGGLVFIMLLLTAALMLLKLHDRIGTFAIQSGYWKLVAIALAFGFLTMVSGFVKTQFGNSAVGLKHYRGISGKIKILFGLIISNIASAIYFAAYFSLILALAAIAIWLLREFFDVLQNFWLWLFATFGSELAAAPVAEFLGSVPAWFSILAKEAIYIFAALIPFIVGGVLLLAVVIIAVLSLARVFEAIDRRRYQDCSSLIGRDISNAARIFVREEHGYNTNQNHLISVVHVKRGFLRLQILRVVFWAINTLAIYMFNQGKLGGIPTIMSARWSLIDNGARVIFMTNYVGPWDSYINEFSELDGVRGVNAIWSNTALPDPHDPKNKKLINFPLSSFLLWKGAENEREFKSFIRASQVETLVWYGAYTDLSVSNINNNTNFRNSLFDKLSTAEFQDFVKRI